MWSTIRIRVLFTSVARLVARRPSFHFGCGNCDRNAQCGLPPHDRPSPPLYMLMFTVGGLLFVPPFLYAPLLQGHLNRAWRQVRAAQAPVANDWLTVATAR